MINQYVNSNTLRILMIAVFFLASLFLVYFIYHFIFKHIKKKVLKTQRKLDEFILNLFRIPTLWIIFWIMLKLFSVLFLSNLSFYSYLLHINTLLLIFSITWIIIQSIKASSYYLQSRLDTGADDNLNARKSLTQLNVFKGIANTIVVIVALSIGLLTFKEARTIGISLLTSAGVIGIIVGLAAQKSIAMILSGIQIAITQPIRLDDVVVIEGEWGRIEEITLTYVVVKIWDERRLILPVSWFLEKPFQNWTRTGADITGSIFLYVDYSFPVENLRRLMPEILANNLDWDKRFWNVQVTNTNEQYKEVRVLVTSRDASKNWDLKVAIREQLIDFINDNYPDTFVKIRIKTIEK